MVEKIGFYKKRIEEREEELKGYKSKYNLVSFLRFIDCLVLIVFGANYFFGSSFKFISVTFIVVSVIVFFALIKWHNSIEEDMNEAQNSVDLNSDDIKRSNGEWKSFSDTGEEYLEAGHGFSGDLDVFGKKSFFQWINATRTIYGREALKDKLLFKDGLSKNEIYRSQKALKELSEKYVLREKFLSALRKSYSKDVKKKDITKHYLLDWVQIDNKHLLSTGISVLKFVAPAVTCIAIVFMALGMLDFKVVLILLAINLFIVSNVGKEAEEGVKLFDELKGELSGYVTALALLEKEDFKSDKLNEVKSLVKKEENASEALGELYKVGSWLNDRQNAFYKLFNAVFYWDYHLLARAERWKVKHKDNVGNWMRALGEFEALESLSVISGEEYVLPTINDDLVIEAMEVVHPMLLEVGVSNSFTLDTNKRVALITGSNMSGKSTFLRTVGFSMFMSYLGLGVKGKEFSTPIVNIYTCMRTTDNLNESISSFYAEILRVKNIVDASKRGERIIFLLDEIFKGTNSVDRHEGAQVLINQLLEGESIGLVSTHDLELCDMETDINYIINYNFREFYEENKLRFDYKLRRGVSKTRNARYLMRMAGIEIE
ncbi:DNA mismatch repair protein MutS [uncultured Clostridium sp.]|jgi:DNA mismatch repair ATPase MutS|uniref:MutS-related protein n=1 Tax=uncultured Clostridium sp. TaxID=59620 RepID=UPI002603FAE4|nr:DNA mismatch repair protein MutS [uncultured Clostridium sp.]